MTKINYKPKSNIFRRMTQHGTGVLKVFLYYKNNLTPTSSIFGRKTKTHSLGPKRNCIINKKNVILIQALRSSMKIILAIIMTKIELGFCTKSSVLTITGAVKK